MRSLTMTLLFAMAAGVGLRSAPAQSEETTVESLKDLQELRKEVERRRQEMRRELRLLSQVLGNDAEAERLQTYEQSLHEMTAEELVAEMRILREEIEQLKDLVSRSASAEGERRFKVTGQVRDRFEWIDDDFTGGEGDLVSRLRSRLRITGAPHEKTLMVMELQDSRLWGEETSTVDGSAESIDFHQAYIELDDLFSQPLTLKLGRQVLSYGNERLVGSVDWHNVGRSFDAVKLSYGKKSTVDLFNAKLDETGLDETGSSGGVKDRNLFGIYGHVVHNKEHAVEPYLFYEQDKNIGDANRKRATAGVRADGSHTSAAGHGVGYELEGALQAGKTGGSDVFAWMASGSVSYSGPSWTRPWLQAGADFLSGDSAPGVGDAKAFDTLFAANHKFYGLMDLFNDIPTDTGEAGLVDFRLKGEMSASEKTRVGLHLHHFALSEGSVKNLGQEADVVLTYAYNDFCSIQWAGLIFVPGDAMKGTRGGEDPGFKTYLQLETSF